MHWVITIPKSTMWEAYQLELGAAANGALLNYRTAHFPKEMKAGDRCYIVHDGRVRGWMKIVGLRTATDPWACSTTGTSWPAGKYIQRTGAFHSVDGPAMRGFRGVRKYEIKRGD